MNESRWYNPGGYRRKYGIKIKWIFIYTYDENEWNWNLRNSITKKSFSDVFGCNCSVMFNKFICIIKLISITLIATWDKEVVGTLKRGGLPS